jgi:hypothetical protein
LPTPWYTSTTLGSSPSGTYSSPSLRNSSRQGGCGHSGVRCERALGKHPQGVCPRHSKPNWVWRVWHEECGGACAAADGGRRRAAMAQRSAGCCGSPPSARRQGRPPEGTLPLPYTRTAACRCAPNTRSGTPCPHTPALGRFFLPHSSSLPKPRPAPPSPGAPG